MITKEKIKNLIDRAYACAKAHGFHDETHSAGHMMMLALGEVGEMVEADRNQRHADLAMYNSMCQHDYETNAFLRCIKDTVEDEMADVVIRLLDFCGAAGVVPFMAREMVDMGAKWEEMFGARSFSEQSFVVAIQLVEIERTSHDDAEHVGLSHAVGAALSYVFEMARFYGTDLLWHIEQKMTYNELRPRRHGKAY